MFIECGEISCKILILIIFPIFFLFRKIILKYINDNYFFDVFRFYLSYILSIIFVLIIKRRTKIESKEFIIENFNKNAKLKNCVWINPLKTREENELKEKNRKKLIYTFLLSLIGLLTNLFYITFRTINKIDKDEDFLFALNIGRQSFGTFFEIIYFLIFGKLILKNKLYRHHFISLIIMIFNLILIFISYFMYFKMDSFKVILYYSIYNLLFCLSYSFGKKYLNIFYITPYYLMVNIGIITCFILLIYDIIAYLIVKENNINIHGIILGFKNNFNLSFIFFFILDIIIYFLTNIGIWLTVYYFTPFHFIICEYISEYIYYAFDYLIKAHDYKYEDILLYCFVYVINFFFCLVFNEIIIIKFWNIDYNTKKNIEKREKEDTLLTSQSTYQSCTSRNTSLEEIL